MFKVFPIFRDIYSGHSPLSKLKNREEFEGGLKKTEEFEETSNKTFIIKVRKNKEEFRQGEGEQFFWLA